MTCMVKKQNKKTYKQTFFEKLKHAHQFSMNYGTFIDKTIVEKTFMDKTILDKTILDKSIRDVSRVKKKCLDFS